MLLLFNACRPLPASRALSQSISLDSATRSQKPDHSHAAERQASDAEQAPEQAPMQAPVIAPHPLHSPFESPPSGLPTRYEGPVVTDYGHIGPTSSLVPTDAAISASTELTHTYDSRTGSSSSQVCWFCASQICQSLSEQCAVQYGKVSCHSSLCCSTGSRVLPKLQ